MPTTLAIVGAGRVGRALGLGLRELGWPIGAVVTQSEATARAAVRTIGGGRACGKLTRHVLAANVVLVATPDDAVYGVAKRLARMGAEEWRGKVALHTSGALDRTALAPLERRGAATGSMHPLQTFSGRRGPSLEGLVFAIEGSRTALRVARRMVRELGGVAVLLEGRHKPAYHAAGVLVAGHLLGVVEAATRILMAQRFTRRQAIRALLPLVRQTLENFERLGPGPSWTGPVARGDYATVARHAAALRAFPREYRDAYAVLARLSAAVLAREPRATLRRLSRTLGSPSPW
ncbi:MAG TPA: Rossmann-like and DUF2520 domain-containing protein [Candidatus Acidoferrales bacterium]|nr:Rossmann-like and DUF2520 domain-containing protein [Candidatus Acidoferrales bacterium]